MDKADRTPGDGELGKQICLWLFTLNFLSLENIHNRI